MSSPLADRLCNTIYEKGYGSAALHLTNMINGGTSVCLAVSYAPRECCEALQEAGARVLPLQNGWIHLIGGAEEIVEAAERMEVLE